MICETKFKKFSLVNLANEMEEWAYNPQAASAAENGATES